MARPKGLPKTGGRQKGTVNRLSLRTREQLWQYCQDKGVNPFEHAVDVLAGEVDGATLQDMLDCAKDLRSYLLPKLRTVEVSSDPAKPLIVKMVNYGNGTNPS